MIKKFEVKPFIIKLYCNKCGEEMKDTNIVLSSYPPQYQYICPKCNSKINSINKYPEIIYDVIEEVKNENIK